MENTDISILYEDFKREPNVAQAWDIIRCFYREFPGSRVDELLWFLMTSSIRNGNENDEEGKRKDILRVYGYFRAFNAAVNFLFHRNML